MAPDKFGIPSVSSAVRRSVVVPQQREVDNANAELKRRAFLHGGASAVLWGISFCLTARQRDMQLIPHPTHRRDRVSARKR